MVSRQAKCKAKYPLGVATTQYMKTRKTECPVTHISQQKPLESTPPLSRSVRRRPLRLVRVTVEGLVDVLPERVLVVPTGKRSAELEVEVVQHQRLAEELEGTRS